MVFGSSAELIVFKSKEYSTNSFVSLSVDELSEHASSEILTTHKIIATI
jgi:hypothetical protein